MAEEYGPLTVVEPSTPSTVTPALPSGPVVVPVPMSREDALAKATEYVDKLATNGRGYQDGVRFGDKVAAVERLARFLMGEEAGG
ncbi:hypothetical protein [Streptomyces sp. 135]|uniref:hypothetical protein n=1 Tax=Streptomyces sp. 135 TaxID=2838850 RepID=UPI001CBE76FB|nr:hypothetical protein [Streptomyces sp. 135]